ncbi:MAG: type IV pilus twitching motility protein PilT [Rickettsiales bacterium]|nr:type IV pilus twitching motility protein PilT [Rickettsiales bacterium]
MDITELLVETQKRGASDLHLSSTNPPIIRMHGDMMPIESDALGPEQIKAMIYAIMTEQQRTDYEREMELDFSISFGEHMRFRVNAFNTLYGPAAVFRTIPTKILSLEDLKAPEVFKRLTKLHKGLILVTGPTGSGKSTTLAAMVNHINSTQSKHIITIEDPIEFVHKSKKSLVNQREVGANTKSFSRALKSCLREDPDIILVGELRDLETIQLAMTAAETGHLVMGTLHTNTAPKTIDRVIDVFPANDKPMIRAMLSVSIQAIISQALVKTSDGHGRVAAHEIMLGTPAVRNLIREGKVPQLYSLIQTGSKMGMITMKDSLYALLSEGKISSDVVEDILAESMDGDSSDASNVGGAASKGFGNKSASSF